MSGSLSDYLENKILDHMLGGPDFVRPATVYLGLWTSALSDASTGSSSGEATFGGYARVAVTNNSTNFPGASAGGKSNGSTITFPTPTSGAGQVVTHVGVFDASSSGNLLMWADLTSPITVVVGSAIYFNAGDLTFSAN